MGLQLARPLKLWSIDCEAFSWAFYRKMGRQAAEVWRNVMAVEGGFQVDKRCCFGSAADRCSEVLTRLEFPRGRDPPVRWDPVVMSQR